MSQMLIFRFIRTDHISAQFVLFNDQRMIDLICRKQNDMQENRLISVREAIG